MPDPRWGEWDGAREYYNGAPPDRQLGDEAVGADIIGHLDPDPSPPALWPFYAGFPSPCFDQEDRCVSEYERCDVTVAKTWKNFATIICLLYSDPPAAEAACYELFPEIESLLVDLPPFVSFMPASITFRTPCQAFVVAAGTNNVIQLALQALYAAFGTRSIGPFDTVPLWWTAAQRFSLNVQAVGGVGRPLFMAGHSYGGASCAVLASVMKWNSHLNQIRMISYGMPRPGSLRIFPYLRQVAATHLMNPGDPVPQLPPNPLVDFGLLGILGSPLLGQWQSMMRPLRAFFLAPDGTAEQADGPLLTDAVIQSIAADIAAGAPIFGVTEHNITRYLDYLYAMTPPLNTCRLIQNPAFSALSIESRCC